MYTKSIDFMEYRLTEEHSIVEDILEKFGEKFLLVGGNMASRSLTGKIYCKIFSSLPQIKNGSYIPAIGIGPRVSFVFHKLEEKCKEVTMQEQIKKQAWAFCKTAIYTPQAYGYEKPKKQKYICFYQIFYVYQK